MIILDIETSGADPYRNSIMSIWALELENPDNQFYGECKIIAWDEIQERALEVNWFTVEQITDITKMTVNELILEFMNWSDSIEDQTIWGHNVGYFDLRFMEVNWDRTWLKHNFWLVNGNYKTLDLHTVSYEYHKRKWKNIPYKNNLSSLNLDTILGTVWLPTEPKPHNALNGAKYEAEAFSRYFYGKKLLPEFEKYEIPSGF